MDVSSFHSFLVTMPLKFRNNQQVTNRLFRKSVVGTPEAVCPPSSPFFPKNLKFTSRQKNLYWNQWLAGLIDGDGCFQVSQKGYCSLEITVSLKDVRALAEIKQKCGGSLKNRAGSASVRYRLHNKRGIISLVDRINGEIRHPNRQVQLLKVCAILDKTYKPPVDLTLQSGWFAGFFDADGTLRLNLSTRARPPQCTLSVTQKQQEMVLLFKNTFNIGSIYFDRSQNGYWTWTVQRKTNLLFIVDYFKMFPRRTSKVQKLHLVPKYYKLLRRKAHLAEPSSPEGKAWKSLVLRWNT